MPAAWLALPPGTLWLPHLLQVFSQTASSHRGRPWAACFICSLVPFPGVGLLFTVHVTTCCIWLTVVSPLEGEGPVGSLAQDRCWELLLPLGDLDGFHPA